MMRNVETSLVLHRLVSELRDLRGTTRLLFALLVSFAAMIVVLCKSCFMSTFYGLHLVFFGAGLLAWKVRGLLVVLASVLWLVSW